MFLIASVPHTPQTIWDLREADMLLLLSVLRRFLCTESALVIKGLKSNKLLLQLFSCKWFQNLKQINWKEAQDWPLSVFTVPADPSDIQ